MNILYIHRLFFTLYSRRMAFVVRKILSIEKLLWVMKCCISLRERNYYCDSIRIYILGKKTASFNTASFFLDNLLHICNFFESLPGQTKRCFYPECLRLCIGLYDRLYTGKYFLYLPIHLCAGATIPAKEEVFAVYCRFIYYRWNKFCCLLFHIWFNFYNF